MEKDTQRQTPCMGDPCLGCGSYGVPSSIRRAVGAHKSYGMVFGTRQPFFPGHFQITQLEEQSKRSSSLSFALVNFLKGFHRWTGWMQLPYR